MTAVPRGLLVIVSSPSGAGKTTLTHRLLRELILGHFVHAIRRFGQRCAQADLFRRVTDEPVVAREARATKAQTGAQIFVADARVRTNGIKDGVDVCIGELLRDHAKLVREADLGGDVAVDGNLRQLGADD